MREKRNLALCAAAVLVLSGGVACGSSDGSSSGAATSSTDSTPGGTDQTTGTDGMTATDGTDGQAALNCQSTIRTMGQVVSSGGNIVYQNQNLSASITHVPGGTCVNSIEVNMNRDGGCQLGLTFQETQGVWLMTAGKFAGDEKCGEFWPAGEAYTYDLDVDNSVGALINVPAVQAGSAGSACGTVDDSTPDSIIKAVGSARFVAKGQGEEGADRTIEMKLQDLGFKGTFVSTASGSATTCPQEPRLCQGVQCGLDYFGADCGGCGDGMTCVGGTCEVGGCNATSVEKTLGYHIGDQNWITSDSEQFNLHSLCGDANAVWLIKTAHWCGACYQLRFEFQRLYDYYSPRGVKFVLLVGQDMQGAPATPQDAKDYKLGLGYQDGWYVLSDPNWTKSGAIIEDNFDAIPEHIILDKDLILRFQSSETDFVAAPESALLKLLTQQGN